MKKFNVGYIYILKQGGGMFHPMQITVLRFLIGGAVLQPFARRAMRKRGVRLTRADAGFFALLGFLFVVVAMMAYQMAVLHTPASVVAVLFSCNPIFIALLAGPILKEPIRRNHVLAVCVEAVAALIIVDPIHTRIDPLGCALALTAALVFALYSVFGRQRAARLSGIAVTSFCSLFGGTELLLLLLLGNTAPGAALFDALRLDLFARAPLFSGLNAASLPWALYLGVINTGLGFVLHMLAMEKTSAQTASLIFFLKPILAPLFAVPLPSSCNTRSFSRAPCATISRWAIPPPRTKR